MSSKHPIGGLRVDVPTREPHPVLLHQLSELSATSTRPRRRTYPKVVAALASVAVLGTTTWLAGAVPGTDSPLAPAHHRHEHSRIVSPAPIPPGPAPTPGAGPSVASGPAPSMLPTPASTPDGTSAPSRARSATAEGLPRVRHDHHQRHRQATADRTRHHAGSSTNPGQGTRDGSDRRLDRPASSHGQGQVQRHPDVQRFPLPGPRTAASPRGQQPTQQPTQEPTEQPTQEPTQEPTPR